MNAQEVIHVVVDAMPTANTSCLDWLSALSTPTIAALGIWIALQQLRIKRNQFRSDLMDKRFAILKALRDLLSVAIKDRHPDLRGAYEVSDGHSFHDEITCISRSF